MHLKINTLILLVIIVILPTQSTPDDIVTQHRKKVLKLIKKTSDLSYLTSNSPLLEIVIYKELIDLVELMLKHKANPNVEDKHTSTTPLHRAACSNNTQAIKLLLEAGAGINNKNVFGDTPIHRAVRGNSYEALYTLLHCKAQPNVKNSAGHTPLHEALEKDRFNSKLEQNRIKTITLLLKYGAQPLIENNQHGHVLNFTHKEYERAFLEHLVWQDDLFVKKHSYSTSQYFFQLYKAEAEDYKTIARLLIAHMGLYSKQSRIARQGLAQVLPLKIAQHIASYLPEYTIYK